MPRPVSGLVGPDEPGRADDVGAYVRDYLAYRNDLFGFEQVENWCLAAALLAIAAMSVGWLAQVDEPNRARARLAASALVLGSVISSVTQAAYLGAEDRVLAVAHLPEFDAAALATMIDRNRPHRRLRGESRLSADLGRHRGDGLHRALPDSA